MKMKKMRKMVVTLKLETNLTIKALTTDIKNQMEFIEDSMEVKISHIDVKVVE